MLSLGLLVKGKGGEVQYVVFVLNTWKCVLTRQCWKVTTKVCCLCNLEMDDGVAIWIHTA